MYSSEAEGAAILGFEEGLWGEEGREGEHGIREYRLLSPTAFRSNFPASPFGTLVGSVRTENRIIDLKEDGKESWTAAEGKERAGRRQGKQRMRASKAGQASSPLLSQRGADRSSPSLPQQLPGVPCL